MLGAMQDWPLLIHRIIDHAAVQHGDRAIITRSLEGPIHRTDYRTVRSRALRVAKRLDMDGVRAGDRVATLAWNTWRHVEAWYGIVGIGAVCHTVNPRLFPEQIVWIANHAEDRIVMVDPLFVPLLEGLAERLRSVERYVVLSDDAHMPRTSLRAAISFETWLAEADDDFAWRTFDENTAAGLCYTSGTTGRPKGVLYSHRSNVLHAMGACATGAIGARASDVFLVVVPMFHANAWAKVYSLPMTGAAMVLPGARLDGAALFDLMDAESVTMAAGVPTVWMNLLAEMRERGRRPRALVRLAVGGSAFPRAAIAAFEREFGIDVYHAWGMTEMSPLGTVGTFKPGRDARGDTLVDAKAMQGHAPFGVEMMIADEADRPLPWDGRTFGRLKVRGPAVAASYFREARSALDAEGYLDTGDIATIEQDGTLQIVDRAKDLIKSGGEWISSVEIESLALSHPDVVEAAVIGVFHPKWTERPLLVVAARPGRTPHAADVLAVLRGKIPSWWLPDDVQFVPELPHTAIGKLDKVGLRALFADYRWPAHGADRPFSS